MNTGARNYTAAEIGRALGISRQAVQRLLSGIIPTGQVMVQGNLASAWCLAVLPAETQEKLARDAARLGYRNADHLLSAPPKPRASPVPLAEAAPAALEKAAKLERALRRPLALRNDISVSSAELERAGVEDYAREFGHTITDRHLRGLLKRTVERDGGAENFDRLELYLDERPPRSQPRKPIIAPNARIESKELEELVGRFQQNPTNIVRDDLLERAVQVYQLLCLDGGKPSKIRHRLVAYLFSKVPSISTSEAALAKSIRRRQAQMDSGVYGDQRLRGQAGPAKRKAPPIDKDQVDIINYYAATRTGTRRTQAVNELAEMGLITDPRIKHSLDTRGSKYHILGALRQELSNVKALHLVHIGPRSVRKMVPPLRLTFEGMFSMDMVTGDDKTADLYVPIPDGHGWYEMLRPQLLIYCDVKSMFVGSRSILPRSQYTAVDTLLGFKRFFMKYGLPRFIQREGGTWRKSHAMNSLAKVGRPFSEAEIEIGIERHSRDRGMPSYFLSGKEESESRMRAVGIDFKEVYAARGKVIERVIGVISDQFEKLPGYCGRDEKVDCPEATKRAVALVNSKKQTPQEAGFMTWNEFVAAVDAIIENFNVTKQEGRRLRNPLTGEGLSPVEAFEIFQNRENPPIAFDSRCAVLLSHERIPDVYVKEPNLRRKNIPCGYIKVKGNVYCNEETGRKIGQKLIAWFDPEAPETCTFTDELGEMPFTVPRLEDVNGWIMDEKSKDALAQARSPIAAVKADFRAMEAKFEPILRRNIVSADTAALSAEVKKAQETMKVVKSKEERHQRRVQKVARELGMTMPQSHSDRSADVAAALEDVKQFLNEKEQE